MSKLPKRQARRPFATLPMYDWGEIRGDWDALWAEIRESLAEAGVIAEARLRLADDPWPLWTDPQMVLGQTCGWPLISRLKENVVVLGRFDFGLEVRKPGDYFSVFVARRENAGSAAAAIQNDKIRLAVNATDSQSGFRAFGALLDAPVTIAANRVILTGSHRQSIRKIAGGHADIAAIDANSWQLALRHEPAAAAVDVIGRSPDMPGLPLIAARELAHLSGLALACCANAIESLSQETRNRLFLRGVVNARASDYLQLCGQPYCNIGVETA